MRSGSLDLHSPVKSSTRYRVSGRGLKRARKKGSGREKKKHWTVLSLIHF